MHFGVKNLSKMGGRFIGFRSVMTLHQYAVESYWLFTEWFLLRCQMQ